MFKDSVLYRRAVIPASGFYEWSHQKEKHIFTRKDAKALFMAGFYKLTEKGKCCNSDYPGQCIYENGA